MSGPVAVSIVIPTYNERENIDEVVRRVDETFRGIEHELLVVDDSSPDGTGQRVRQLAAEGLPVRLIERARREGIGAALRTGYDAAGGRYVGSLDADLSFPPEDLLRLYRVLEEGADLALGERHGGTGSYDAPKLSILIKRSVSRAGNRLMRLTTGIPSRDFTANFRMIRLEVWRSARALSNRNAFLFEMIVNAWISGAVIRAVPVTFADRRFGASKLRPGREALALLGTLITSLWRHRARINSLRRRPS
ncbi:MAG: Polyprenol monophosphomannose synthase [Candidatus Omnitrophica bacterium]|nr:Polyprenol monophosphomannose synthase [Candidatus Omnitrophota bacterium]